MTFVMDSFTRDGIAFPFQVLEESEAAEALRKFEKLEEAEGGAISPLTNFKPHLVVPWLSELVRNPGILDVVEKAIGPNILCWMSNFFTKDANDRKFISWHQDSTYWELSSPEVVTAWVALTPSRPENGCLQVVPGSHLLEQVPHRDTYDADNMLSRGQQIAVDVDPSQVVDVVLEPGQMSLHHVRIFHGSEPNRSKSRRIGFAIRYIPTHMRQIGGRTTALLVRGTDQYNNFDPEPIPREQLSPDDIAFRNKAMERLDAVTFKGARAPRR